MCECGETHTNMVILVQQQITSKPTKSLGGAMHPSKCRSQSQGLQIPQNTTQLKSQSSRFLRIEIELPRVGLEPTILCVLCMPRIRVLYLLFPGEGIPGRL